MTDRYPLKPFRVKRKETLHRIITEYPLATLFSGDITNPRITLLPLMIGRSDDDSLVFDGHLDRNNPHAAALQVGMPVAFVFQGPNAYASPDLYPTSQLPGWLYLMVKGHGAISEQPDDSETRIMLSSSTKQFGEPNQKFTLSEEDPRIDKFIGGITAFKIKVEEISGIAKLAQNKGRGHSDLACQFLSSRSNEAQLAWYREVMSETLTGTG